MRLNLRRTLQDARLCFRLERTRSKINRQYWTSAEASTHPQQSYYERFKERLFAILYLAGLPMLVPVFAYLGREESTLSIVSYSFLALVCVLLLGGRTFLSRALYFSAFDVLRMPSKQGLFLMRYFAVLPILLWVGCCWAGAYVLKFGSIFESHPLTSISVLLAIVCLPALWFVGKAFAKLTVQDDSALGPVLTVAICGYLFLSLYQLPSRSFGTTAASVLLGLLTVGAVVRTTFEWVNRPRRMLRALRCDMSTVPRWAVAIGVFVPAEKLRWLRDYDEFTWIALTLVVLGIVTCLVQLCAAVRYAEEEPVDSTDDEESVAKHETSRPIPTVHVGRRSLMRAMWFRHCYDKFPNPSELASLRKLPANLLGLIAMLIYHFWGCLLAVIAVLLAKDGSVASIPLMLAALTAPGFVTFTPGVWLYRLGLSYRSQAMHDLYAILCFAALPVLLAAVAAASISGWSSERAASIGILAGLFCLRMGWKGLCHASEFYTRAVQTRMFTCLILLILAALLALPATATYATLAATLVAGGIIGILLRVTRMQEPLLAAEMRNIYEGMQLDDEAEMVD